MDGVEFANDVEVARWYFTDGVVQLDRPALIEAIPEISAALPAMRRIAERLEELHKGLQAKV